MEKPAKAMTRPGRMRNTLAPSDRKLTPVYLKVPPVPPQHKRVLVLVDLPAVRVKKREVLSHKNHVIIDQVLGNNVATTVRNREGPTAILQGEGNDGAAVVDIIAVKSPVVIHTRAARSARLQVAVPTATVVAATQTATVVTAQRGKGGGTPSIHQILNMNVGKAEDAEDPEDIITLLPPQKTLAHAPAATAEGRDIGTITEAVQEVLAAGAAAPARDHGGAATAAATALPVGHPAQPKTPLADEARGAAETVRQTAGTSTALASTAPSLPAHLHHEALTVTATHPARSP